MQCPEAIGEFASTSIRNPRGSTQTVTIETPYADDISRYANDPALTNEELDAVGRGYLENLVRLIVSLLSTSANVKHAIFRTVIDHPQFAQVLTRMARKGLADDLKAPRTLVHEVDAQNIRFEPTYSSYRTAVGSSRIATVIGGIVGLLAGILAMTVINATPVAVDVAHQTASIGVSSAVDQPWFIIVCLVITTLIGACLGGIKQRYGTVHYVSGVRPVYAEHATETTEGR